MASYNQGYLVFWVKLNRGLVYRCFIQSKLKNQTALLKKSSILYRGPSVSACFSSHICAEMNVKLRCNTAIQITDYLAYIFSRMGFLMMVGICRVLEVQTFYKNAFMWSCLIFSLRRCCHCSNRLPDCSIICCFQGERKILFRVQPFTASYYITAIWSYRYLFTAFLSSKSHNSQIKTGSQVY